MTNASAFSRNTTVSQTAQGRYAVLSHQACRTLTKYDSVIANVTITSTPDSCKRSARIHAPKAPIDCMMIELAFNGRKPPNYVAIDVSKADADQDTAAHDQCER